MIDELVLEALFAETAEEIEVPDGRVTQVIDEIERSMHEPRRASVARPMRVIAAAAAVVVVVVGLGIALSHSGTSSDAKVATASQRLAAGSAPTVPSNARLPEQDAPVVTNRKRAVHSSAGAGSGGDQEIIATPGSVSTASGSTTATPTDGAKIVKTGTVDLQVARSTLRTAVNRVTGIATGLDGYIANSTTNYDGTDPTGQITMRVPVANFEAAVKQLKALPDVKVLGDSETGKDVTAQYVDLQAQLTARQAELNAYNTILAGAQSIPDILTVTDRIAGVQAQINQLQGQINVLGDKSSYSAIAVTLAEKPVVTPAAHVSTPPTGLSKAWQDARNGFSNSLEWMLARSGGALIAVLAFLVLLFALRYLYPVVRRALL